MDPPLAALTFAVCVVTFQNFLVIPALPAVGHDLHTSPAWATWIFSGFVLTSAIAAPLVGKLGDRRGRRRALFLSMTAFFVGAVGAAAAPDIRFLIGFRMLQGVGNAVMPLGYSIAKDRYPPERLAHAAGVLTSGLTIGTTAGFLLGGVVDVLSWRALFGIAAGFVALAFVLLYRYVPETSAGSPARPDVAGGVLLAGGLTTLLLAITQGSPWGWGSPRVVGLFVAATVFFVVWALVELRTPEPMVDVRLLTRRPVLMTNAAASLGTGFAVTGALVAVPRLLAAPRGLPAAAAARVHYGFGASTLVVGLYMLPWALGGLPAGPLSHRLGGRRGARAPLALGLVLIAAGLGLLAVLHAATWEVLAALTLVGFGFPLAAAGSSVLLVSMVRHAEAGVAMGMNAVIRQIGSATGAQAVAAILAASTIGTSGVATERAYEVALVALAVSSVLGLGCTALIRGRGPGQDVVVVGTTVPVAQP